MYRSIVRIYIPPGEFLKLVCKKIRVENCRAREFKNRPNARA